MEKTSISKVSLQWKWVIITFFMYVILYPIPLFVAHYALAEKTVEVFVGMWFFAGIIIIAALAGYLSEGVTLWEPAIAGAAFIALSTITASILTRKTAIPFVQSFLQIVFTVFFFFLLSLLGAWLGERAQRLWKKEQTIGA